MHRRALSALTIVAVVAIVSFVQNQSCQAQLFRRFLEDSSNPPDSRQGNAKGDNRQTPDPRAAGQTAKTAPTRGQVDPRQQPNAQVNRNSIPNRSTSPAAQSNKNSSTHQAQNQRNSPSNQAQRPQSNRPLNSNSQSRSALSTPSQQTRPVQAGGTYTQSNRIQAPGASRSILNTPTDARLGPANSPSATFNNAPLTNPKLVAEPDRATNVDTDNDQSKAEIDSSATHAPSLTDQAAGPMRPVDETEVLNRFGLRLVEDADSIAVKLIDPDGNAAKAGLQVGDQIVSFGGAPIGSQREFTEIASLLSVGDQIELVISRKGQEEKSFIQYGRSTDATSLDLASNEPELKLGDSNWSATPQDETEQLKKLVAQQQQVIAELQQRVRELENNAKVPANSSF